MLEWLIDQEAFTSWCKSSSSAVLTLLAPQSSNKLREHLVRHLRQTSNANETITTFSFNSDDARFCSLGAFLNATISDLIRHSDGRLKDSYAEVEYDMYKSFGTYNTMDALHLLIKFHTHEQIGPTVFVIENDRECPELEAVFWHQVQYIMETGERPWKFLLLRSSESPFDGWPSKFPSIPITKQDVATMTRSVAQSYLSSNWPIPLNEEVVQKWAESISKHGGGLEKAAIILKDPTVLTSISTQNSAEILRHIESQQNKDLKEILDGIMLNVPLEQRPHIGDLINCMLIARRPLNRAELQDIAYILGRPEVSSKGRVPQCGDVFEFIDSHLPGVFNFTCGEARLQHPEVKALCFSANYPEFNLNEAAAERTIARLCLAYIRQPTFQFVSDKLCRRKRTYLPPISRPRDSLADYAVHYWHEHMRRVLQRSPSEQSEVFAFFRDEDALQNWAKAFHSMSNPVFETNPTLRLPSLAIIARTGLCYQFEQWIRVRGNKVDSDSMLAALREAVCIGNPGLAKVILDYVDLKHSKTETPELLNALRVDNEKFACFLTSRIIRSCTYLQWSPIFLARAAFLGHKELLDLMIQNGASVDIRGHLPMQRSLLHLAARNNHLAVTRLLLEKGPDNYVDYEDEAGNTALHLAASFGHPKIIQTLCEAGADKDKVIKTDNKGHRPISCAVQSGKFAALDVLLEAGADPKYGDDEHVWAPLPAAASHGFNRSLTTLLKHGRIDLEYISPGGPALCVSVSNGHVEASRTLLDHGADPDNEKNTNPLLVLAAKTSKLELVKMVFERTKPSAEIVTRALYHAAMSHAGVDVVKFLLKSGADANGTTPQGNIIHTVAFSHKMDVINAFIEAGADLNVATNEDGWTPLHIAWSDAPLTRRLIEAGADANISNKLSGVTPLHLVVDSAIAKGTEKWEVAEAIIKDGHPDLELKTGASHSLPGSSALAIAVYKGNADMARLLLEAGADPNSRTQCGGAVAMQLSVNQDVVRTMLEFEPDLESEDDDGDTVLNALLTWTSIPVSISVVRDLLRQGASIERPNKRGKTPLFKALYKHDMEIARLLLKRGANPLHISKDLGTPLHAACQGGPFQAVKLMLQTVGFLEMACPKIGTVVSAVCSRDDDQGLVTIQILDHLHETATLEQLNLNEVSGMYGYPLGAACFCNTKEVVGWLLKKGASIRTKDGANRYPIHFAAYRNVSIFQHLCDHGADLAVRDKQGRTTLHIAVQSGSPDLVEFILRKAKHLLKDRDKDNWTPLHYALRSCSTVKYSDLPDRRYDIVEMILDEDICARNDFKVYSHESENWSILKFARFNGADRRTCDTLEKILEKRSKGQWNVRRPEHMTKVAYTHRYFWCDYCYTVCSGVPVALTMAVC
jgi:ankyrin repeat protein